MNVGDDVLIINTETGESWEETIICGSSSAGVFETSTEAFWASGVQWRLKGTAAPRLTCKVIRTKEEKQIQRRNTYRKEVSKHLFEAISVKGWSVEEV